MLPFEATRLVNNYLEELESILKKERNHVVEMKQMLVDSQFYETANQCREIEKKLAGYIEELKGFRITL